MLTTRPLHPAFGVIVEDLDLNEVTEEALFPEIRAAFEEHSALLFPGQAMTEETHFRLARLFGPLEDRHADERPEGEAITLPEVSNIRADGSVTEEMDLHTLQLKANMQWHCDSTFMPVPALCNILAAQVVTETGGATEFASTRAAFAAMDEDRREALRGLTLTHHYAHSRHRLSEELAALPMFHKWPAQTWRAVWRNPVNGREAVYVASHAYAVSGTADEAAQAFIDQLVADCTRPEFVYAHHWTPGDVMIWDQRAVIHRATPWPYDQPRRLTSTCTSVTAADGLEAMRA